jgi:hypothetical protein
LHLVGILPTVGNKGKMPSPHQQKFFERACKCIVKK